MSHLFAPLNVGPFTLSHRIAMAPLSRLRSDADGTPIDLAAEYYGQRASQGGLLISEGIIMAEGGNGYLGAPGLSNDKHVPGWKKVTDAVHAKNGRIFAQLWHVGRVSHTDHQPGGRAPGGPSVVPFESLAFTTDGWVPTTPSRALEIQEIEGIVDEFRKSTERAVAAGFDGVEIHAANGYLLDQFLQDGSNKRTDQYGGSFENRARFMLAAIAAAASVIGINRVGVRISPSGDFGSMIDSDPEGLFAYVATELNKLGIAYLHLIEPRVSGNVTNEAKDQKTAVAAPFVRKYFKGVIVAAGGFNAELAEAIIAAGDADVVAFGRTFIANPDLPERIRIGATLTPYNRDTFYGGLVEGYTDYPFLARTAA